MRNAIIRIAGFATLCFFPKLLLAQACPFELNFAVETACPLLFDGSVTALPTGGAAPYNFQWEFDTVTTDHLTNLDVGTYSVTVSDANGCAVVDSVVLGAATRPTVVTEAQDASCFGVNDGVLTITLEDTSLLTSLLGSPPSPQTVYDSLWPGGYQYFVIDTFGCQWVQFFFVDSPDKIKIEMPNSVIVTMCDSTTFEPSINTEPVAYTWSPPDHLSCTDCPNPTASPFANTTYYLTVTDSNGCSALDSIRVNVDFSGRAYIPNVFSPNGDGINDAFYVLSRCVEEVRLLRIFDRWGEMVFEAKNTPPGDPIFGWNGKFRGKDAAADVFVYHIIVTLRDGTELAYKGDLTLLR